ncbi:MAG: 2Fe-2S iron-sulfur cluster-binding protein, partial [Pseudomonadota bacterium]
MTDAADALNVRVWRGKPANGGAFHSYEVPRAESQTILDVVTWIQQNAEPTLTYRFACRVGMCGSCAMMVNGAPRWTCRTHVRKVVQGNELEIAPLRNLPVIKDLTTDMTTFFDKWTDAQGMFHGTQTRHDDISTITPDDPKRRLVN